MSSVRKLNSKDIIALKRADHIVFASNHVKGKVNLTKITAAKQTGKEEFLTWDIDVLSDVQYLDDTLIETVCFAQFVIPNSCINWNWQTICGILAPGDELEIIWQPDSESSFDLVEAGFHIDTLRWIVYRNTQRFHYLIGVLPAPYGDQRMISGLKKKPMRPPDEKQKT
jgi:hypothetical protein